MQPSSYLDSEMEAVTLFKAIEDKHFDSEDPDDDE